MRSETQTIFSFPQWLLLFSALLKVSIPMGFPGGRVVKNPPANGRDASGTGSIPGSGRSPGEGNGNPLQYSCLENSRNRGAWWATVQGLQRVG